MAPSLCWVGSFQNRLHSRAGFHQRHLTVIVNTALLSLFFIQVMLGRPNWVSFKRGGSLLCHQQLLVVVASSLLPAFPTCRIIFIIIIILLFCLFLQSFFFLFRPFFFSFNMPEIPKVPVTPNYDATLRNHEFNLAQARSLRDKNEELENRLATTDETITELIQTNANKDEKLADKDAAIAELTQVIDELTQGNADKDQAIADKDAAIAGKERDIAHWKGKAKRNLENAKSSNDCLNKIREGMKEAERKAKEAERMAKEADEDAEKLKQQEQELNEIVHQYLSEHNIGSDIEDSD